MALPDPKPKIQLSYGQVPTPQKLLDDIFVLCYYAEVVVICYEATDN